ncbi:MAG: hypothetical protein FJW38_06670, partial [Acidobacteria bacterium]|nr:hypothetical protein [Acidobacteriota bacterium]
MQIHLSVLSILVSAALPAATLNVTNNFVYLNSQVTGAVTDDFNTTGFTGSGSASPWATRNNVTYSVDRTTDSNSFISSWGAGAYQPTGVMAVYGTLNGQLTNVVFTPAFPTSAIAFNHTTWRGNTVRFDLTFSDGSNFRFFANSAGQTTAVLNGTAQPGYTGLLSDVLITSIRMESTVIPNDVFSRGLTFDNVALATAIQPLAGVYCEAAKQTSKPKIFRGLERQGCITHVGY